MACTRVPFGKGRRLVREGDNVNAGPRWERRGGAVPVRAPLTPGLPDGISAAGCSLCATHGAALVLETLCPMSARTGALLVVNEAKKAAFRRPSAPRNSPALRLRGRIFLDLDSPPVRARRGP